MKKYDTSFIKDYIESHREEIKEVSCGMKEDWFWTAETIYEENHFSEEYDWNSKSISVAGISGSTWATPVMEVCFKDGITEIVPCYFNDGKRTTDKQIKW